MHKQRTSPLFPALALTLALAACAGSQERVPPPSDILGPYTATGTITATGASLFRRGTHVLLMDGSTGLTTGGSPRFFLESRTVDLNQYEGKHAVVQGELFPNTHPMFLPVLQVSTVFPQEGGTAPPLQRYEIPALSLSLEAPSEWESELTEGSLTFRLPVEGAVEPPVVSPVEPFFTVQESTEEKLPQGLPLRVSGQNAVRVVEEATGQHRVYVERSTGGVLLFVFAPGGLEEVPPLRDAFYKLLRSVRFAEEEEGEEEGGTQAPVEEDSGIPCGGPAHVLCPEGQFCEVKELDTGIGVCRKL